ncbi:MAG: hypothetical protein ACLFRI_05070 [Candidatus Izemoplasmataceae bacterium]
MSDLNFVIYQNPIEVDYIQLQVGKGKKHQPSIYIDKEAFDCIRGVIWNKYREFGNQEKINQIKKDDWLRILQGFDEALVDLKTCNSSIDLVKILSIPNHLLIHKERFFESIKAIEEFIETLTDWIETNIRKEKSILIINHFIN